MKSNNRRKNMENSKQATAKIANKPHGYDTRSNFNIHSKTFPSNHTNFSTALITNQAIPATII